MRSMPWPCPPASRPDRTSDKSTWIRLAECRDRTRSASFGWCRSGGTDEYGDRKPPRVIQESQDRGSASHLMSAFPPGVGFMSAAMSPATTSGAGEEAFDGGNGK